MNIAHSIYEGLAEVFVDSREVFLEDMLRQGCGHRHHLRLTGAEGKPDAPQDLLLREIELRVRKMVCKYLKGAFPEKYEEGAFRVHQGVTLLVDAFIEDALVEVSVVSRDLWNPVSPLRMGQLSAATKAHIAGKKKALLVTINRDSQEWMFWWVTGDFEAATSEVRKDLDRIGETLQLKHDPLGFASDRTCRTCPYRGVCTVNRIEEDPGTYATDLLKVSPALDIRQEVEAHLWRLNKKPNGRTRKVIHPSSFALERCDREVAYDLIGTEGHEKVNPRLRRIFDTGHCVHDVLQEVLEAKLPDFELEVRAKHKELRISGSCDGVIRQKSKAAEIKSIGSKGYAKLTKAKTEHERQATIYGALLDLDSVVYIYVNKESGEVSTFDVPLSRALWHKMAARATNINKTVDAGDMPPRIEKMYICEKCKYAWTCMPKLVGPPNPQKRKFR